MARTGVVVRWQYPHGAAPTPPHASAGRALHCPQENQATEPFRCRVLSGALGHVLATVRALTFSLAMDSNHDGFQIGSPCQLRHAFADDAFYFFWAFMCSFLNASVPATSCASWSTTHMSDQ